MRTMRAIAGLSLLLLGGCGGNEAVAEGKSSLELVRTIPLEGIVGRIDHMALDAARKRLVVAGLGADAVAIVDLERGAMEKRIGGFPSPQGVLALPGDGTIVVSCEKDGSVRWLDPKTFVETARVDLGEDADNLRYDATTGRAVVGYAERLGFLEKGKLVASAALKGHPEAFQVEAKGPFAYVNVPEGDAIQVVDRAKAEARAFWPMKSDRANFPMALDEARSRLYVGCRAPAVMLVYDTSSTKGEPVARVPISGDVDDLFVDDLENRLYLSCGEGFVDVVERGEKDAYARVERIPTAAGARTSLFDPATGTLYVAVPNRALPTAELRVYRRAKS